MQSTRLANKLCIVVACAVAGYLFVMSLGGLIVFGFRDFEEFCLFGAPVCSLPAALVGFRSVRLSAALWFIVMVLFFGVQAKINWPHVMFIRELHTHFASYLFVLLLLVGSVFLERFDLVAEPTSPDGAAS
jgi:hypothetical protein